VAGMIESETDEAAPQPSTRWMAQPKTEIKAGTIKQLFAAVKALTSRAPKPAPPKKSRKRRDEDKGRTTWRKPLERRFLDAITAALPPPDRFIALAADVADTLDCMHPFEPPAAFTADIDGDFTARHDWNFPQP
jgi:hypothetical protein